MRMVLSDWCLVPAPWCRRCATTRGLWHYLLW